MTASPFTSSPKTLKGVFRKGKRSRNGSGVLSISVHRKDRYDGANVCLADGLRFTHLYAARHLNPSHVSNAHASDGTRSVSPRALVGDASRSNEEIQDSHESSDPGHESSKEVKQLIDEASPTCVGGGPRVPVTRGRVHRESRWGPDWAIDRWERDQEQTTWWLTVLNNFSSCVP